MKTSNLMRHYNTNLHLNNKTMAKEIPVDQKIKILENEILGIENEMYPLEVRARISKKVGDDQLNQKVMAELERLQKYIDAYEEEIRDARS